MKKKIITITIIAVLAIAMGTTALATTVFDQPQKAIDITKTQQNRGFGFGRGGRMMSKVRGFMMDENGDLLDKEAFEAKLNAAIEDGTIKAEDKDFYLERYENCANNGGMMFKVRDFMMDENGKLLDKEAFEAKLNAAIEDGTIKAEDKDFYLERYENCTNNVGMMQGRKGMMQGRSGMMQGRNCGR